MYVYAIHTYVCLYMPYIHICTSIYTYIPVCLYIYVLIEIYVHIRIHIYITHIYMFLWIHICTYMYTYMYTCSCLDVPYIYMHMLHVYLHIHVCTIFIYMSLSTWSFETCQTQCGRALDRTRPIALHGPPGHPRAMGGVRGGQALRGLVLHMHGSGPLPSPEWKNTTPVRGLPSLESSWAPHFCR